MKYSNNNIIVVSNYLLLEKYAYINIKEVIRLSIQVMQLRIKIFIVFLNKYYSW